MRKASNQCEWARTYLLSVAETMQQVAANCAESIVTAAQAIAESLRHDGKLLVCGNGGSAADSQHLAGEFVSLLSTNYVRPPMAAVALTTDTSILTAISNDFGYAGVFERQVEGLGRPGDVLLGISTSGNSESVIRALERAKKQGMKTVALTGRNGGRLKAIADIAICIPSGDVQHTQEAHLSVEHLLSILVEQELYGKE